MCSFAPWDAAYKLQVREAGAEDWADAAGARDDAPHTCAVRAEQADFRLVAREIPSSLGGWTEWVRSARHKPSAQRCHAARRPFCFLKLTCLAAYGPRASAEGVQNSGLVPSQIWKGGLPLRGAPRGTLGSAARSPAAR